MNTLTGGTMHSYHPILILKNEKDAQNAENIDEKAKATCDLGRISD